MPLGFPIEGFESALTYEARVDDIFISTYPKCGTTWMQHVVWLLLHGGQPLGPEQRMTTCIPHLEEVGRECIEALAPPRVIKTHLPFALCPYHPQARYIYVVRNPFDCAVSFFHHTRGFIKHYDFAAGTFDDFFEVFVRGEVDFGDYFENVLSWLAHADDPNVLVTSYEAMQGDLAGVVAALGAFLGSPLGDAAKDPALVARILEHSSFASMSKDQLRWASKRPDEMPPFVRKGIVGDWLNHYSPAQCRRLLARLDAPGSHTLAALWPETVAAARTYAKNPP